MNSRVFLFFPLLLALFGVTACSDVQNKTVDEWTPVSPSASAPLANYDPKTAMRGAMSANLSAPPEAAIYDENMTFDGAVVYALVHNPDLQAARIEIERAKAHRSSAGLWPNPTLEFEGKTGSILSRSSEGSLGIGFAQAFPVTNRLRLAKEIADIDISLAQAEVQNRERQLAGTVRAAYLKIAGLNDELTLNGQAHATAVATSQLVAQRKAAGQASSAESALALVEQAQLEREARSLESERQAVLLDLRGLLGLTADNELKASESLDAVIAQLDATQNIFNRPDLSQYNYLADQARLGADLASAEKWGDLTATLSYSRDKQLGQPTGYEDTNFIGLGLSIPLPLWNDNVGQILERREAQREAEKQGSALRSHINLEVISANRRAEAAKQNYEAFARDTLKALTDAEAELDDAYKNSGRDLLPLLQVRRERVAVTADQLQLREAYALALNDAATATGVMPKPSSPSSSSSLKSSP